MNNVVHFSITIGWWLFPAIVTLAAFIWNWWMFKDAPPAHDYGRIGDGIARALIFSIACVISLVVWFIWAVLT